MQKPFVPTFTNLPVDENQKKLITPGVFKEYLGIIFFTNTKSKPNKLNFLERQILILNSTQYSRIQSAHPRKISRVEETEI